MPAFEERTKQKLSRQSKHSYMAPIPQFDFDVIVIGSGFGGSVSALRLVEKGYRVAVMEMGRRWPPDSLPHTSWSIHRWFWRPKLGLRGFFNMRLFRHVTILHGCAVGGGSITFAGTLLPPPEKVWESGTWTGLADWKAEMPQHYHTAAHMLGVTENKILGPADHLLKTAAESVGCGATFYRTKVAILQPADTQPGQNIPDPFFGGEGPRRATCTACGGCIMGCRYAAKNSLDFNYLYLAEKYGARVFPETKVVNGKPLVVTRDGSAGYEVRTVKSTAGIRHQPRRFHRHRHSLERRRLRVRVGRRRHQRIRLREIEPEAKEIGQRPDPADEDQERAHEERRAHEDAPERAWQSPEPDQRHRRHERPQRGEDRDDPGARHTAGHVVGPRRLRVRVPQPDQCREDPEVRDGRRGDGQAQHGDE